MHVCKSVCLCVRVCVLWKHVGVRVYGSVNGIDVCVCVRCVCDVCVYVCQ